MALPKIDHPVFELTLPSNNQKVNYRPFLVKEEKILLMAQESQEQKAIISAVKQIINNCIMDGNINIDKLPSFDIEYFFIKLRAKSISNIVDVRIRDKDTDEQILSEINLDELEIHHTEGHTNLIDLKNGISIKMQYPTMEMLERYAESLSSANAQFEFELVADSITTVFNGDEAIQWSNQTEEERTDFLESLHREHWKAIQKFYTTMPKLRYVVEYINKNDEKKTASLEGLNDFFG